MHLNTAQRIVALRAMVEKLLQEGITLLALSVDDHHFHLLARFPGRHPRRWVGRAKMHAAMLLRETGLRGGVWARGLRALPIRDRAHQVNVFRYITEHGTRAAVVWTYRDRLPERE